MSVVNHMSIVDDVGRIDFQILPNSNNLKQIYSVLEDCLQRNGISKQTIDEYYEFKANEYVCQLMEDDLR